MLTSGFVKKKKNTLEVQTRQGPHAFVSNWYPDILANIDWREVWLGVQICPVGSLFVKAFDQPIIQIIVFILLMLMLLITQWCPRLCRHPRGGSIGMIRSSCGRCPDAPQHGRSKRLCQGEVIPVNSLHNFSKDFEFRWIQV